MIHRTTYPNVTTTPAISQCEREGGGGTLRGAIGVPGRPAARFWQFIHP
ncbi:hypothetical protein [Nonomuraea sp. NPDC049504]